MVRYVLMALKIGFHSPFGPKFTVEFDNLDPKKFCLAYCTVLKLFSVSKTNPSPNIF